MCNLSALVLEEGIQQGRQEGIQQGRQDGIREGSKAGKMVSGKVFSRRRKIHYIGLQKLAGNTVSRWK